MRRVQKGQPPAACIRGHNWIGASLALQAQLVDIADAAARSLRSRTEFDDVVVKPCAANTLTHEQQRRCVFCEAGLRDSTTRIAHWRPISAAAELALEWRNLFASCPAPDSCDQHQQDSDPGFDSPADRDWSTHLVFDVNGRVTASPTAPPAFRDAIDDGRRNLWNLNSPSLQTARRTAVETELELARDERDRRRVPMTQVINDRIAELESGPLPFQSAVVQALQRRRPR